MDPSAPDTPRHPPAAAFDLIMAATPPPGALDAPAARRNAGPLLAVLLAELPADGTILEIGAGTGQHAAAFAQALLPRRWLPTEMDAERRDSIRAWMTLLAPDGARPLPPRALDAADPADTWPLGDAAPVSAMVSANVIHIAPWAVTLGILAGAARWLGPGAPLILYGPFHRDGRHMSPGNTAFDADLRSRDPGWGIRDLEREVLPVATGVGLRLGTVHEMPANNLCVVLRR